MGKRNRNNRNRIRDEYKRVRKNALARLRYWERKGYIVDIEIPKIPKRITEGSINKIKNTLSRERIEKKSIWVSTETGEIIRGTERASIRKALKEDMELWKKREVGEGTEGVYEGVVGGEDFIVLDDAAGMTVVNNLLYEFSKLNQMRAYEVFSEWLSGWVGTMGAGYVGTILERAARSGLKVSVTEADSERKAVEKTKNYIYRILDLSDEYDSDTIVDMLNDLDYI